MFNLLTDSVENAIDVADMMIGGEIDKYKIAKLVSDGVEIAVIAYALGVTEDVVLKILEEE